MNSKRTVSDAISNYYFQQHLSNNPSQIRRRPPGKENMYLNTHTIPHSQSRPYHLRLPLQHANNQSPSLISTNVSPSNQPHKHTYSTKIINFASSLQKNLIKQNRSDSVSSHKKSVKFAEKVEGLEPVKSLLTHRTRSNSILKTRSMSKDFDRAKSNQLRHAVSSDRLNFLRMAGIKSQYRDIIGQCRRDVKLRVTSSKSASKNHNKYVDPSFPLHLLRSHHNTRLIWKRLSEMPEFSSATVRGGAGESSRVKVVCHKKECYSLSMMLNLIRNCQQLLDWMLEDLKLNDKGAYLLRVSQENQWKYIIIDDFFPAELRDGCTQLAFIGVTSSGRREVWPLLLQKAYAAYLGSFEQLHQIPLGLLFSDLLKLPTYTYHINQNLINTLNSLLAHQSGNQVIFYAEKIQPKDAVSIYCPLKIMKKNQRVEILQQNEDNSFIVVKLADLLKKYKEITMVVIPNMQTFSTMDVMNPTNIGKQIKNRYLSSMSINYEDSYAQFISRLTAKSFSIDRIEHCHFIIKAYDKQERRGQLWSRVLLLQKQVDGYRWIAGKYSNNIISFSQTLEPGKYHLVFMPDRRQQGNVQFIVTAYSRRSPIDFEPQGADVGSMVEKGCCDLAQRTGKMTQINKWICTYTLVHPEAALVIENINNERRNGSIRIFRTIRNLKTTHSQLLPLNAQFYQANRLKDQAEFVIEKEGSASVILLLAGGFDAKFFQDFHFGL